MLQQITEEKMKELGSYHTQKEITHQPRLWQDVYENILQEKENIAAFIGSIMQKHRQVKVILTGAGTSAFLGECLAPYLSQVCENHSFIFQDIPTTNIVSNPEQYLDPETPTIMVSFARSGNSPESDAAVTLGEQLIEHFYQINITCNPEGELAKRSKNNDDALFLCMPEESNDKGLAMTSSFTCMMLAAILTFQNEQIENLQKNVETIERRANHILFNKLPQLKALSEMAFSNVVYLGSGPLLGLSHEAALKMLELTSGNVFTFHDSSLGFRHGPKSLLNAQSLATAMISNEAYTQQYDVDMLKELYAEKANTPFTIMAVSDQYIRAVDEHSDYYFYNGEKESAEKLDDAWTLFPFLLYAQILAFYKSVALGFQPDTPSESGSINRVVQGVTIYPYHQS